MKLIVCGVIDEKLCIEPAVLNTGILPLGKMHGTSLDVFTVTASQEPREYFIGILAVSMLPGSGGTSGC